MKTIHPMVLYGIAMMLWVAGLMSEDIPKSPTGLAVTNLNKVELGTTTNIHTLTLTNDEADPLFSLRLTTNVVTEWLSIPVTTNDLRQLNGETYVEVRQLGMLVTNRTLYVEHDGLTNELILKVLGKGEYPDPTLTRKVMQKVNVDKK